MRLNPKIVKVLIGVGGLLSFTGWTIDILFKDAAQKVAINEVLDERLAALDEEEEEKG